MSLSLHVDRPLVLAGAEAVRFVVCRITAPACPPGWRRPPASIAFCVDRSSSMRGAKLAHAKLALIGALARLQPRDLFSIVAYDANTEVLAAGLPATRENVVAASRQVRAIDVGLGTNLSEGWLRAAGCVENTIVAHEVEGRVAPVGRCLLLTDGQPSCGERDRHVLARHAANLRARGVATSCFGVGTAFDERLLTGVADAGGGAFRYLDGGVAISAALQEELVDALDVVARDVELHASAGAGASLGVLGPYPIDRLADAVTVTLPDLAARQVLEIVLHLEVPPLLDGGRIEVRVHAERLDAQPRATVIRAQSAAALRTQRGDRDVIALVAERFAAAARERAALLNRAGEFEAAALDLLDVARRLRLYVGADTELLAVAARLEADADLVQHRMDEGQRKSVHAVAASVVRSRRPGGGSWRP